MSEENIFWIEMSIKRKDCECLEREVTVAQGDWEESEKGKIPESLYITGGNMNIFSEKKKEAAWNSIQSNEKG